jgi:hypothetical protein
MHNLLKVGKSYDISPYYRDCTQVNDQQRRPILHSWSSYLLFVDFLFTLKNNIAILYERKELPVNKNSYGVIKSLMESPIWVDLIAATLKYENGQHVHVWENITLFEEERAISDKLMT